MHVKAMLAEVIMVTMATSFVNTYLQQACYEMLCM
jgi:hypothetical protein